MILRKTVSIAARVDEIWPLVADPSQHTKWNPKVVSVSRQSSGAANLGETFQITYQMSGSDRESQVEVIECQWQKRIVFRHRRTWKSKEHIVKEAYELVPSSSAVEIIQSLDMSNTGIPWVVRVIIAFIYRFGWSPEISYLNRLKDLAEKHS